MKTREEIEQEYRKQIDAVLERHIRDAIDYAEQRRVQG